MVGTGSANKKKLDVKPGVHRKNPAFSKKGKYFSLASIFGSDCSLFILRVLSDPSHNATTRLTGKGAACIAGGIAQAYWGVPGEIEGRTLEMLDDHLSGVVQAFDERFRKEPTAEKTE